MSKTLIIAGHGTRKNGTFDPGATGLISKGEHKYVKEDLFPAMKRHLPSGHDVVFFDSYNVFDHGNIVALAKQYGATQVVEVHYDAGAATASGGHVIIAKRFGPDAVDLALRDAIEKMVGVRYSHNGHKGISGRDNLSNVNRTANGGVSYRLIELGFGTNKNDADVMVNKVDDYAKVLVKALTGSVSEPTKVESKTQTGGTQVTAPKPKPTPAPAKPRTLRLDTKNMMNGEDVKKVQRAVGVKADGWFGPDTDKAVRAYQASLNLDPDGIVGALTWEAIDTGRKPELKKKSKPTKKKYQLPTKTLRRGAKGKDVGLLQTALNAANFKVGKVDNDFGAKTHDAVRRFQSVYLPLEVDGVAGPNTYRELDKVVNK